MESKTVISQPFFEIERAHVAFDIFELDSAQIGSGRPGGPRSALCGSIVVLARASLEEALRRVHRRICVAEECAYTKVPLDPSNFRKFFADHGVTIAESIPVELHVALRSKPQAKGGDGTGFLVNGPLTASELLDLLAALNHIRNGFAHRDPKKTEALPPGGSGVLWVAPETGTEWTVQKPHAFSAMRFCHSVFRYAVLSCWGPDNAIARRSSLPQLLEDRLAGQHNEGPLSLHTQLGKSLERSDLKTSLALARSIQESLLSHHIRGAALNQGSLQLDAAPGTLPVQLFDPVLPTTSGARGSIESATPPANLLGLATQPSDEEG